MCDHQDWKPVIFKKTKVEIETVQKNARSQATQSTSSSKPAWKIEQQVDSDQGKPIQYVSKTDAQSIITARVNKKLSQKDLATRMNMQVKDIQEIENCKAVENKNTIAKIKKFLCI